AGTPGPEHRSTGPAAVLIRVSWADPTPRRQWVRSSATDDPVEALGCTPAPKLGHSRGNAFSHFGRADQIQFPARQFQRAPAHRPLPPRQQLPNRDLHSPIPRLRHLIFGRNDRLALAAAGDADAVARDAELDEVVADALGTAQ